MKIVVVIGNGFDLDLGLPTRYEDFLKCDEYYSSHVVRAHDSAVRRLASNEKNSHNLFNYLRQDAKNKSCWGGIEGSLYDLSRQRERSATIKSLPGLGEKIVYHNNAPDGYLKASYEELKKALMDYLNHLDYDKISRQCNAYKLYEEVAYDADTDIYSFNYTSLQNLSEKHVLATVHHVHGSLKQGWIILGFQPSDESIGGYSMMEKNKDPNWIDPKLSSHLIKTDDIIFFGQSFSDSDMWYFEDFFKDVSTINSRKKNITFYCYNGEAYLDIVSKIARVCDFKSFCDRNVIRCIFTDPN